jgi:hypothetical protein
MVISYIYSTCWHMKSVFYERQQRRTAQKLFPPQDETTLATLKQEPGPQKRKRDRGIRSSNKMQEGIIKVIVQFPNGSPIEPKGVNSKWCNDYGVLAREKCKIT